MRILGPARQRAGGDRPSYRLVGRGLGQATQRPGAEHASGMVVRVWDVAWEEGRPPEAVLDGARYDLDFGSGRALTGAFDRGLLARARGRFNFLATRVTGFGE